HRFSVTGVCSHGVRHGVDAHGDPPAATRRRHQMAGIRSRPSGGPYGDARLGSSRRVGERSRPRAVRPWYFGHAALYIIVRYSKLWLPRLRKLLRHCRVTLCNLATKVIVLNRHLVKVPRDRRKTRDPLVGRCKNLSAKGLPGQYTADHFLRFLIILTE